MSRWSSSTTSSAMRRLLALLAASYHRLVARARLERTSGLCRYRKNNNNNFVKIFNCFFIIFCSWTCTNTSSSRILAKESVRWACGASTRFVSSKSRRFRFFSLLTTQMNLLLFSISIQQKSQSVVEHAIDEDLLLVDRILAYRTTEANLPLWKEVVYETNAKYSSVTLIEWNGGFF